MNSDVTATADQGAQVVNAAWPIIAPYIQWGLAFVVGLILKQPWKWGKK
jgi:short subunit fatty acids transporter